MKDIITAVAKSGAWALLAFWLIYTLLIQKNSNDTLLATNIAASTEAISHLSDKMDMAQNSMTRFSLEESNSSGNIRILLIEVCVQQAEALKLSGGTQRCFDAARGIRYEGK